MTMAKQKSTARPTDTDGVFALCSPSGEFLAHISEEDVPEATSYRWHRSGDYVARTYVSHDERPGKQCLELLQRRIAINAGWDVSNAVVKFADCDGKNCVRGNLVVQVKRTSKYYPAIPRVDQSGVFPRVSASDVEGSADYYARQLELPLR